VSFSKVSDQAHSFSRISLVHFQSRDFGSSACVRTLLASEYNSLSMMSIVA